MSARPLILAASFLLAAAAPSHGPQPSAPPGPADHTVDHPADHPALVPTRDVVLGYHLAPPSGEAINVRVSLQAGGEALRVDLPDQSFMVASPADHQLVLVVPLEQTAMQLPWTDGPQALFTLDPRTHFTRKGEATVAGQHCTMWDTALDRARGSVCVTTDGVVLRSQTQDQAGRRGLIEAFAVRYQALVESDFAIPAGFDHLSAVPQKPSP